MEIVFRIGGDALNPAAAVNPGPSQAL